MTLPANDSYRHPASFRDSAGFMFRHEGLYYRQVNESYASNYQLFIDSGLYRTLIGKKLLIAHEEISENLSGIEGWHKTLLPEQLTFTSFPYEWGYDQFKDAALLTLQVLTIAIDHGMILKDATSFNIQFLNGKPIFIDTLSFEQYDPAKPWIAYRQFCESFLFPLFLGHYLKTGFQKFLLVWPEGIPAQITASMLPWRSRFNLGVWLNVLLQNSVGARATPARSQNVNFSKEKLLRLSDHLRATIARLQMHEGTLSHWNNYYEETILSREYLVSKEKIFSRLIEDIRPVSALDLGCNDGYFSKVMARKIPFVIATDFDASCINRLYLALKKEGVYNILPLCIDITNPSPAIGFANEERSSFLERNQSDIVVALALVHHLVLTNNIPLSLLASHFAKLARKYLIIEFVPLEDEKSKQLLLYKTSFHQPYDEAAFEEYFGQYFVVEEKVLISGSQRILYRMKKK
jgi:2-polyprenyl-3-methyl-5-hydroxy-6-metoxy-1,4-benzoquinol methylase